MRLAVLTSGGDAPGMNACIRAVVRAADVNDFEVLAIRRGYQGVCDDDIAPPKLERVKKGSPAELQAKEAAKKAAASA